MNYSFDSINTNGTWDLQVGYGLLDAHRAVLKAAYHKVYGDTALTLCDTNRHAYTVRAPHNANIDSVSFFWTCSDNLQMVAGQNTDSVRVRPSNGGIGQLQCHIIHDGDTVTSSIKIPIVSNRPVYDNVSLSGGFSFPDTFVLSREIVIDSLAGLNWQNKTVLCTPDCRIIVRPGGFMTLDHTTLTSACPNRMWQGIEVTGDRSKPQTLQSQGALYIENGSVIENAFTALRNSLSTDNAYTTTGGIVQAYSSTFRNNCRAVEFSPYAYSPQSGLVYDYSSVFRQCLFTVNNQNLFAANDTVFTEHAKLWEVRGVTFKGCSFHDSTSTPASGTRGVYTEDAGLILDTYCDYTYSGCVCSESHATYCSFTGFATAVEVNTTGFQYPVLVNQVLFSDNGTGVIINGNHFATVTRCDFDMQNSPVIVSARYGLYLNNCTGYHVEENSFRKLSAPSVSDNIVTKGIMVTNSGNRSNQLHRNDITNLSYGVYASGNNSALQMTCNSFLNNLYGIYSSSNLSVSPVQGAASEGADNSFKDNILSDFYHVGSSSVVYYYSTGGFHTPTLCYGVSPQITKNANLCSSTLCDNGGIIKSLADFQTEMDAETYYESVRAIMSDTVLDLAALEQWHTAAQPIADPYSLTETRFCEEYSETFAAAADDAELSNYADFHAMKLALRNQNDNLDNQDNNNSSNLPNSPNEHSPSINWYALTPAQLAELQVIAERNTGRASVMAKGVLCFFFGICYDDEVIEDGTSASQETRAKQTTANISDDAALTVYPNPTDDILSIELSGAGIAHVALYDLQGRMVYSQNPSNSPTDYSPTATMNMQNVHAGVYVLRVTDADGQEYHRKIVKR